MKRGRSKKHMSRRGEASGAFGATELAPSEPLYSLALDAQMKVGM
jgi:hypothetical protein